MRKYFLTTVVALMAATNVNALGEGIPSAIVGNLEVGAQILMGQSMTCDTGIMFAPIVMDSTIENTVTLAADGSITTSGEGVISAGNMPGKCELSNGTFADGGEVYPLIEGDGLILTPMINTTSEHRALVSDFTYEISDDQKSLYIGAKLTIPANTASDVYMATMPLAYLYE